MKNMHFLIGLLAFLLLCSTSCSVICTPGEGEVNRHEVDLDLITGIVLEYPIDVELRYGQNQKIEVNAHDNHLALLNKKVSGNTWHIGFNERVCSDDISMIITLPLISLIRIEGSGDVHSSTPMQAEDLDLDIEGSGQLRLDVSAKSIALTIEGSGDVTLNGNASNLDADIEGSGTLEAQGIKIEDIDIRIDGSGDADVHAVKTLDAILNGSGSIKYEGNPKITSKINGSGEVRKK